MRKPRIAVIGLKGLPAFGGAATVGENIIEQLKNDFDFTVYSISSHTTSQAMDTGYRQIVFKRSAFRQLNTFMYFLKSLAHALFVGRYDLIHLHHYSSGYITPFLRTRYKVVSTFHGIYRDDYFDVKFGRATNLFLRLTQWMNMKFASRIVSVSKPDAAYLEKKYRSDVTVIPNGVKIADVQATRGGNYMVFAAGRIYDIKGLHILLEAMHLNKNCGKLLVIGNLDHSVSYRAAITTLAAGLDVEFLPLIKDKRELFGIIKGARVFIFPSLTEAMSMMLLEVAALNVPLIVSDIEANKAIFDHHHVSFFKSGDSHSLALQLNEAQGDKESLEKRAAAALLLVNNNFTWTEVGRLYKKLFNELLK